MNQHSASENEEKLLAENKACERCDLVTVDDETLKKHNLDCHKEQNIKADKVSLQHGPPLKPLSLYKCNECSFATTTTDDLQEHKKESHKKE